MASALEAIDQPVPQSQPFVPHAWWRERPFVLLLLFVVLAYFSRMTDLPIRGEEPRRGLIAREMLETGDWVVPRTQGVPLFSRPPLQNWLIALVAIVRGDVDAVAIRLPSVCAILLTCVLIYRYCRLFLGPLGAFASAMVFASMGQVLELGRVGETDALFTLFVGGALLCWHGGLKSGESAYRVWCVSYALAALGMLTKGLQAPVYFVGAACLYLLWQRDWKTAFSRAHLAGIATFLLVLCAWQIPCLLRVGLTGVRQIWFEDAGHRFLDKTWLTYLQQMTMYPVELLACLLPWSALFIVWCNREFRRTLGPARDFVLFLVICLAVAFPTVWISPGARPRYFMSLYPCLAILMGLAAQRVSTARRTEAWWIVWPLFVRIVAVAIGGAGLALFAVSVVPTGLWLAPPLGMATVYAMTALGLAVAAWRSIASSQHRGPFVAVLAIAGFVAFSTVTIMLDALKKTSNDTIANIAELRRQLPPEAKLVSFNVAHHLFVFHYRGEIPVVPWPASADDKAARVPYFCVDSLELESHPLPFPWTPVTEIPCDRIKLPKPVYRVVIGRRDDVPGPIALK